MVVVQNIKEFYKAIQDILDQKLDEGNTRKELTEIKYAIEEERLKWMIDDRLASSLIDLYNSKK
tara:strand:+ start:277 stop:468 length:192 start_codon:yes stop_codon:yes gene_type:complete